MKGIAIQTILLLLIGVLVVGLLVYFVYRTFSGTSLNQQECREKVISWCSTCSLGGYVLPGLDMGSDVATCVNTYYSSLNSWVAGDDCNDNRGTPRQNSSTICPLVLPG